MLLAVISNCGDWDVSTNGGAVLADIVSSTSMVRAHGTLGRSITTASNIRMYINGVMVGSSSTPRHLCVQCSIDLWYLERRVQWRGVLPRRSPYHQRRGTLRQRQRLHGGDVGVSAKCRDGGIDARAGYLRVRLFERQSAQDASAPTPPSCSTSRRRRRSWSSLARPPAITSQRSWPTQPATG